MRYLVSLMLLTSVVTLGCSNAPEQVRFRVSGTAKFAGKDIPYGDVLITPDDQKKNTGAQAIAIIRDGKFDTAASDGKGYGGGPAIIRITGLSAEGGKLLCEHEYPADLPKGDATHDINVPAKPSLKQKTGPEI